jgi:hypothetical protein
MVIRILQQQDAVWPSRRTTTSLTLPSIPPRRKEIRCRRGVGCRSPLLLHPRMIRPVTW